MDVSQLPLWEGVLKGNGRKEILPVGRTLSSVFSCHLEKEKASDLDRTSSLQFSWTFGDLEGTSSGGRWWRGRGEWFERSTWSRRRVCGHWGPLWMFTPKDTSFLGDLKSGWAKRTSADVSFSCSYPSACSKWIQRLWGQDWMMCVSSSTWNSHPG